MKTLVLILVSIVIISFSLSGQGNEMNHRANTLNMNPSDRNQIIRQLYADTQFKDLVSNNQASADYERHHDLNRYGMSFNRKYSNFKTAEDFAIAQDLQGFPNARRHRFIVRPDMRGGKLIIVKPDSTVKYYLKVIRPNIFMLTR
jgi:hypothetical protein